MPVRLPGVRCYNQAMMSKSKKWMLGALAGLILLAILGFAIPVIREPILYRLDQLRIRVRYWLNPPEEAVFIPESSVDEAVQATMRALSPSATPTLFHTHTPTLPPEADTPTTMPTATPLPASVQLDGMKFFTQRGLWNYCAPSNLAMALSFWEWEGKQTDVGPYVKPFDKDKNVMPYELGDYVAEHTGLRAIVRSGGTAAILKSLIASGFPVLIEKGVYMSDYTGSISWMGHYQVLTGYDDSRAEFIGMDSYYGTDEKPALPLSYADLDAQWRPFNYIFLVVYPPDREPELLAILGEYADSTRAEQIAAERASAEIYNQAGQAQFFAWFNRGTSLMRLQDYYGAAQAYDSAFQVYASLEKKDRPWRAMWYQTGPYFAYYFSGRYWDVISLATNTIDSTDQPYLEESFYWRARAYGALGDTASAGDDIQTCVEYHPGFLPCLQLASELGLPQP